MTLVPFENEVVSCVSAVLRWGPEFFLKAVHNTSAGKRDAWPADLAACLTIPEESLLMSQDPTEENASVSPEYY